MPETTVRDMAKRMETDWLQRPTMVGPIPFLMAMPLIEGCQFLMSADKGEFLVGLIPPKSSPIDICHGRDADIAIAIIQAIRAWQKANGADMDEDEEPDGS